MKNNGANIEVTVYENSHHSFDRNHPPQIAKDGYKLKDGAGTMVNGALQVVTQQATTDLSGSSTTEIDINAPK